MYAYRQSIFGFGMRNADIAFFVFVGCMIVVLVAMGLWLNRRAPSSQNPVLSRQLLIAGLAGGLASIGSLVVFPIVASSFPDSLIGRAYVIVTSPIGAGLIRLFALTLLLVLLGVSVARREFKKAAQSKGQLP